MAKTRSWITVNRVRGICLTFLIGLLPTAACSDADSPEKSRPQVDSPYSHYSVKIFAGADRRVVELPPAGEAAFRIPLKRLLPSTAASPFPEQFHKHPGATAKSSGESNSPLTPAPKPQIAVETDGGGVTVDGDLSTPAGWALVYGAAYECGVGTRPLGSSVVIPPWTTANSYFVFSEAPQACDDQLAYEEALLCIADKLAEIAETPAPVTWAKVPQTPKADGMPPGPWVIPPQATRDRFVARDLSIHILSILGFTDLLPRQSPSGSAALPWTCATAYGEASTLAANSPQGTVDYYLTWVFGEPNGALPFYLPPTDVPVSQDNFKDLAKARMVFNAHVLRSAGRLLHDQIGPGVTADMAGGERQRALATDPARGAKLLWGAATDADEAYNSLAHSTRLISGRWERGVLEGAAWLPCGTIAPMRVLQQGMQAEYSARHDDQPIRTATQEEAAKLVDQAGIVIPTDTVLDPAKISQVRTAVVDQLVANAAKNHGLVPSDPGFADFTNWGEGRAVALMFEKVADEDLRFGLLRTFGSYRQLVTREDAFSPVAPANPGGGMTALLTVGTLSSVGGAAIDGGIPRADLTRDITSRTGGIEVASQCNEFAGVDGTLSTDFAISADFSYVSAFQDAYHIGETFRKRLVALREEAARVHEADEDVVRVPAGGAIELRTWTGPGRMVMTAEGEANGPVTAIRLFLIGFNAEDFGIASAEKIKDEVALVHGLPWVADCAARSRSSCPANFDQQYVATPIAHKVWSDVDPSTLGMDRSWSRLVGSDGTIVELVFRVDGSVPEFKPVFIGTGDPDQRVYVVARHDPIAPGTKGMVLGPMAPRTPGGATSGIVSKHKKKQTNEMLGIPNKFVTDGLIPTGPSTDSPSGFCIEGIPREPFVPLENEITSDADPYENSWRHYLNLAKNAAAQADELGQKVIELGLQKDLRREAAGEKLADICGDYTALDEVPFDQAKGTIGKSTTDKALNTCLGEDRFDVVFLTTEPPELVTLKTESERTAWIKNNVLRCNSSIGGTNPLCAAAKLTHAGLGISEYTTQGAATADQCAVATSIPGSLLNSFSGKQLQQLTSAPWVSAANFAAILAQLEIQVSEDGHWALLHSGAKVMDTHSGELWPGCINPIDKGCTFDQPATNANPLSVTFDKLFRRDKWPPYLGQPDGRIAMLWRVQGALWLMGGLAGKVPEGLFTAFVPAARLEAGWSGSDQVPLPTVYADGRFKLVDWNKLTFALDFPPNNSFLLTNSDTKMIGEVKAVDTAGFDYSASSAPQWLKDVYSAANSRYVHVPVSNAAVNLQESHPFLVSKYYLKAYTSYFPADDTTGAWLNQMATGLTGMKCQTFSGDPAKELPSFDHAVERIGFAKLALWNCEGSDLKIEYLLPTSPQNVGVTWPSGSTSCATGIGSFISVPAEKRDCIYKPGGPTGSAASAASHRAPMKCSPAERMLLFVNSYPSLEGCTAASELAQAVALGCTFSRNGNLPVPATPPPITDIQDIQKLERWIGSLEQFAGSAVSRLYLQSVPSRVVSDFASGSVGTGSLKGNHGQLVLEMESAVRSVADGWFQVGGRLAKIRAAIEGARLQIDMNGIQSQIESKQLAISRWQVHAKIAHAIANSISGFGFKDSFNPLGGTAQAAAGAADLKLAQQELGALDDIGKLQAQAKDNQLFQILNTLEDTTSTLYGDTYTALTGLQKSTASAAEISEQLRFGELSAQYEVAQGAGADFLQIDGKTLEFPVNIVLNRQYDITRQRYKTALLHARYLAYVARIAIEQRIGMRLDFFAGKIGPLPAPHEWQADVCTMTGVDYEKLRDIVVPDGGFASQDGGPASTDNVSEFSDMFIGDYVDKLERFVEYYNMEYPSHDGDDTAVISLRDDLLGVGGLCKKKSPNLLLYSADLTGAHLVSDGATTETRGWVRRSCTTQDSKCLYLGIPAALSPVPAAPETGPGSNFTWLYEVGMSTVTDPVEVAEIAAQKSPAGIVYQSVKLEAGTYALSWWDQSRTATGSVGSAPDYPATIFDDQWSVIQTKVFTPFSPSADAGTDQWSPRREISFSLSAPGTVNVAFAASSDADPGSVVISDVQLEKSASAGPYWANGSSNLLLDTKCAVGSVASLQQAFEYHCDSPKQCFYELKAPFFFATVALDVGDSKLSGKIAANNFNYRHITVALNVVGTGVVDCTFEPTAACYGSAFLEYSLDHSAFDVEVLSHEKPENAQHFNFGLGSVNHGKALAAEQFITLPVSSSQQGLLSQPAFEKQEFAGRPLEGSYRLRIHDKPSLQWNKVEDLQLILKYRYWSRIQPQPSSN